MSAVTNVLAAFVLAPNVTFTAVTELAEQDRQRLDADDDAVVLNRMKSRARSKVLDPDTAGLLEQFRAPSTIVESVIKFCQEGNHDPEQVLDLAYPVIEQLIYEGFLVPEGATDQPSPEPLVVGADWNGLEIVHVVRLLDDTEIYQARHDATLVALKIARPGASHTERSLDREAQLLARLNGSIGPRLLSAGAYRGVHYLEMEWCDGINGARAAAARRALPLRQARASLLSLARAVATAYAELHRHGIVHSDVHPGNLVVADDGSVRILDFGAAIIPQDSDEVLATAPRANAAWFFEPEYAQGRLADNGIPPPATPRGEQHIVANLIYQMVTGHGYRQFSAEREAAYREVAVGEPEPFSRWGLPPWDDLERTLSRALAVSPGDRFADMTEFAAALNAVGEPSDTTETATATAIGRTPQQDIVDAYLQRLDPDEALFSSPMPAVPRCSITFGSAGVAYFLHRLAGVRQSPELLSWSKLWIEKAFTDAAHCGDEAFYLPEEGLTRQNAGESALYHTITGLHAVRALIARATGDIRTEEESIAAFVGAARTPSPSIDLTLGTAGVLVGCALLVDPGGPPSPALNVLGSELFTSVSGELERRPGIRDASDLGLLGIAHGWAGLLYALLLWCRATGRPASDMILSRLAELASLGEPAAGGLRWRRTLSKHNDDPRYRYLTGWCNGTAGIAFLWTLAERFAGDGHYGGLAERAAQHFASSIEPVHQLCCGRTGEAYAALSVHRSTGNPRWLQTARSIAQEIEHREGVRAPHPGGYPLSLYKGSLGNALLVAEINECPDDARMPFFELEDD
jgi:eukaryotic-like serine/threonine-protein kinase